MHNPQAVLPSSRHLSKTPDAGTLSLATFFEGDADIGELGLIMMQSESLPLSIDMGVQGYVGQKQGISDSCIIKYEF